MQTNQSKLVTVQSILANLLRVILSFLSTILLARLLSAEDYGLTTYLLALTAFLNYFLAFGFDQSFPYILHRCKGDRSFRDPNKLLLVVLGCAAILSLPILFLFTILSFYLMPHIWSTPEAFLLFSVQTFFWAGGSIICAFLRAGGRFGPGIVRDHILFPVIHIVGLIVLTGILRMGSIGYAIGFFFASLICFLFPLTCVIPNIFSAIRSSEHSSYDMIKRAGYLLRISLPFTVTSVIEPFLLASPLIVAGWYLVPSEIAALSISQKIIAFALLPLVCVQGVLAVQYTQWAHPTDRSKIIESFEKWSVLLARIGLVTFVAGFCFPEIAIFIFGREYGSVILCLPILILSYLVECSLGLSKIMLTSQGYTKINALLTIKAALLIWALGLMFAPSHGLIGIAWSYSLTAILLNIIRYFSTMIYFKSTLMSKSNAIRLGRELMTVVGLSLLYVSSAPESVLRICFLVVLIAVSLAISLQASIDFKDLY